MAILSKPLTLFSALAVFIAPAFSAPSAKIQQRQNNFTAVTGPTVGGVQPRLEIRDFQGNEDMYNLFNLAMARFMAMDQSGKLSYFQVAGIHGEPLIDWDGASSNGGNTEVGYCPHGSNLFGPWHRPYVAVFEQILIEKAMEVANQFPPGPSKDRYESLSTELRLPYWDWAKRTSSNEPIVPTAITTPTVSVTLPNGTSATIDNPLAFYRFHSVPTTSLSSPWDTAPTTLRNGNGNRLGTGTTQPQVLEDTLEFIIPSIQESLYQILSQYQTYNQFSNHGSQSSFLGNLESLHDQIHSSFGFNSDMSWPSVAAFDPVFWLHHGNVDRLLAIWQSIYPDTYIEPFEQEWPGTWTVAPGSVQGPDSALTPFRRDAQSGAYHTPESVRGTTQLGYTYPELAGAPSNETVMEAVNELYAPGGSAATKFRITDTDPDTPTTNPPKLATAPDNPRAFIAAIQAPRSIPGAYNINVYLSSNSSSSSPSDPTFIGAHTLLTRFPVPDPQAAPLVKGSVVLTPALRSMFQKGELQSLGAEEVVAYLRGHLRWRAVRTGGEEEEEEIPGDRIPGAKVEVMSTEVEEAGEGDSFPRFVGGWVVHGEVERGG